MDYCKCCIHSYDVGSSITIGLNVTGIYRLSGNAAEIQKLRHKIDQGTCMYVYVYIIVMH